MRDLTPSGRLRRCSTLSAELKDNDVAVVLHHRQPSEAVKAAMTAGGCDSCWC